MAKSRKSLVNPRIHAFKKQNGCCYYCNQLMWMISPDELMCKYNITVGQASLLQCTGEHLVAHKDGGGATQCNIVAACWYCNSRRHRRVRIVDPENYKRRVQSRLNRGGWHGIQIVIAPRYVV